MSAAVSEVAEPLWAEYEDFCKRDLSEHAVVYLFVDGIPPGALWSSFTKAGVGTVTAVLEPLSPLKKDQIVRGTITLDLPRVAKSSDNPVCDDPASTKRFPPNPGSTS